MTEQEKADGGEMMFDAAQKAANEAKDLMVKIMEKELPEGDDPHNAGRQVGALITAATMVYAKMLETCIKCGGKAEAVVVCGLVQTLLASPLGEVAQMAGDGQNN